MAHTPGEWKAMIREHGQRFHSVYVEIPGGHGILADEISNPDNARLMAAARDLLEALKDLCWVNEMHDTITSEVFIGAYNKARAAIAKAEGKEQ